MPEVDQQGRFVVPEFAEGAIELVIPVDKSLKVRPRIPHHLEIYAGKTTRVDVPFEPTVRVRGRVQTKPTGEPVSGAEVSVQYGGFRQSDQVVTDSDGRYEDNVLAGPVRRQLIARPQKYAGWIVYGVFRSRGECRLMPRSSARRRLSFKSSTEGRWEFRWRHGLPGFQPLENVLGQLVVRRELDGLSELFLGVVLRPDHQAMVAQEEMAIG